MQSLFFHPGHVNLDNHICDLSKRYSVDHLGHGPRKLRHHDVAIVIPIKGVEEIHQLLLVVRDLLYYAVEIYLTSAENSIIPPVFVSTHLIRAEIRSMLGFSPRYIRNHPSSSPVKIPWKSRLKLRKISFKSSIFSSKRISSQPMAEFCSENIRLCDSYVDKMDNSIDDLSDRAVSNYLFLSSIFHIGAP